MIDLGSIVPEATNVAERLVRDLPGFFHAIMLDEWRGVRLIYDSEASRACDNHCERCPHLRRFGQNDDQGPNLKTTLFEFTAPIDRQLYGPERFLSCKRVNRYVWCYVNCIVHDPALRLYTDLLAEMKLVRGFRVLFNDQGLANDELAQRMKQRIVSEALVGVASQGDAAVDRMNDVLEALDWDFTNEVFR